MTKMDWDKHKKHGIAHGGPTVGSRRGWNWVKVIDTNTGEVRWEKPQPAKYKPEPPSTAKRVIEVARKNNDDNVDNALMHKIKHKIDILEQIKEKQGFLNQKMQHELNRLKRALNKK